jgi:hypothetical protein
VGARLGGDWNKKGIRGRKKQPQDGGVKPPLRVEFSWEAKHVRKKDGGCGRRIKMRRGWRGLYLAEFGRIDR